MILRLLPDFEGDRAAVQFGPLASGAAIGHNGGIGPHHDPGCLPSIHAP